MELRHLITFRTIVDEGGFKKAADALGYAQSSVTGHIKDLEDELGKPLFDRLGKSITLTEAGKSFLPYAMDIIDLYSKSKEVIHNADEVGMLTIGASESIMVYLLPEIILGLKEKYPRIDITVKSIQYESLSTQLKKGDIDVALLVERPEWDAVDLHVKKIREEQLAFVKATVDISSTIKETMLVTEYLCSWRPIIDEYLRKSEGAKSISKIELPSMEAIKKCVQCGLGKSMLPKFVVEKEIASGELQQMELGNLDSSLGIYTAVHKDKWLSPNMEKFLDFLSE